MKKAYIKAISYYLPEKILTNEELALLFSDWTADKIKEKTGISSRHVVKDDEVASDLAEKAARLLFSSSNLSPNDVDFVILTTQSPDYLLPTTACILQDKLGIPTSAGAFDFNLGCSAYIYGLAMAKALVSSGIAKNILLLTAETYSKYINPIDKSTRTLFGDGASASWITSEGLAEILEFDFGTDGSGYKNLIIPAGGSRLTRSEETSVAHKDDNGYVRSQNDLFMSGSEIFSFSIDKVPKSVVKVLERNRLKKENIDLYVFHQANKFMLEYLRKKIKAADDQFVIDMDTIGNTVSSSIPIALARQIEQGNLIDKKYVLLTGFGVGLSWGSVVLQIGDNNDTKQV